MPSRFNILGVAVGTLIFLGVSALCAPHPAWADDFWSPRTAALGGAGHAGPMLNDAIYMNPSYAAFLPTYSASANYLFYQGGSKLPDGSSFVHGHNLNVSVQDGRTELFQAGAGLTEKEDGMILNVGAARAIIKRLGVGIGGKFVFPNTGATSVQDSVFSVTGSPADFINLAFVVDNMVESGPAQALGMYRDFILGIKVNVQGLMLLYYDPELAPDLPNQSTFGHRGGAEIPVMKDFFIRGGMFHNVWVPVESSRASGWGMGLGWIAPRISLDYAYMNVLDPIPNQIHNFGMTVYF